MSFPIVQVALIFLTSFSFSIPNVVIAATPKWLNETCYKNNIKSIIDPDLCFKILESQKKIVLSRNEIELSVTVIESGISNGTNTQTYIESVLKKRILDPKLKGVFQECKSSYDSALVSLRSALLEVKVREYQTATYDLLIASTDNIDRCINVVASKKIKDATILIGNKILPMFGFIGYNVVEDLYIRSPQTINIGHDRIN
ncbi:hypothetical protein ACS0TY_017607 [Phlomoides rotata]